MNSKVGIFAVMKPSLPIFFFDERTHGHTYKVAIKFAMKHAFVDAVVGFGDWDSDGESSTSLLFLK